MQRKKERSEIKIVKTRKDHECECCEETIPKGTKALVNFGFNYDEGYFRYYFHLDSEALCYDTFMEVCGVLPESEDGKRILEALEAVE